MGNGWFTISIINPPGVSDVWQAKDLREIFSRHVVTTEVEIAEFLLGSVRLKQVLCGGRRVAIPRERP